MISIKLNGQCRSGKNGIKTTRTGHRYPSKEWAKWRDDMVAQIRQQWKGPVIDRSCSIFIDYYAGDKRRRDVPGMTDAIFHCLERAGVITDDKFFTEVEWKSFVGHKIDPCVLIQIINYGE